MSALEVEVREGVMRLDGEKMTIVVTQRHGILNFILYRLLDLFMGLAQEIPLKDISMVSVERGVPGSVCPHLHVHYAGGKSRLIEFPVEEKGKKCGIDKVIDFLEKRNVQLGIACSIE